tara:strand:- start:741 stop:2021 length:1281 start_codon:yes stop_codon:yes gene_type:complete
MSTTVNKTKHNSRDDISPDNSDETASDRLRNILKDMVGELIHTFPELNETLDINIRNVMNDDDNNNNSITIIQKHCESVLPERFFDVLYQNEDIFSNDTTNTEFLPGIIFSKLWKENITDNTKESIWKYLQVLLFATVSNVSDQKSFGDTAKLFEAINEDEFKKKLEDTMSEMQKMFSMNGADTTDSPPGTTDSPPGTTDSPSGDSPKNNEQLPKGMFAGMDSLPNPKDLQDHISEMMDGKLGNLAKEIAEETAADMNMDMNNGSSVNDVFQTLFKQPSKLMSLVKNVGSKLDEKMKSGDIKESELLEEVNKIMQKMKSMPGVDNMKEMFAKMGMAGMADKQPGKMNMRATEANLKKHMRGAQQRDRMRAKLAERKEAAEAAQVRETSLKTTHCEDGIETKVFSTGEIYDKSGKRPNKKKRRKKNK